MDLDVHEYRLCLSAILKPDQGLGELTYGKSRFVYKYSCHVNLLPALSGGALTIEQNDGRRQCDPNRDYLISPASLLSQVWTY